MKGRGRALRKFFTQGLSAMPAKRARWAILFCILIICGSQTGAAVLQMGLDAVHVHRLQARFNQIRATEILASAEDRLDHFEAIGLLFANGGLAEEAVVALPGVRGISVAAGDGQMLRYSGHPLDMPALAALLRGPRTVIGTGSDIVIVYRAADRVVAVAFAANRLLPRTMRQDSALISPAGKRLTGHELSSGYALARGRIWPVEVRAAISDGNALAGYWGQVPVLFIYLVLTPIAAGFWLFWIFRREIIWRAQASLIIRTMREAWQNRNAATQERRRPE